MSTGEAAGARRFPSTSWSVIELVRGGRTDEGRRLLGDLLARYEPALRSHLRRRHQMEDDQVDDTIQEFYLNKVLEHDLIGRADQEIGRFRTLMLTSLDRLVIDRRRRRRIPTRVLLPEDQQHDTTETDSFDVAFAREVLREAIERMKSACENKGRPDWWHVFEGRVLDPILNGNEMRDYEEMVAAGWFDSSKNGANALASAKRLFTRCVRSVVAEYVADQSEIDEEITTLRRILSDDRARLPDEARTDC